MLFDTCIRVLIIIINNNNNISWEAQNTNNSIGITITVYAVLASNAATLLLVLQIVVLL